MSIRVMSQVWENGPADKTELLVMLALADHANESGECWPSTEAIAKKARLSDARSVRRIIRRLEADGWVSITVGGGRHGCNVYRINPDPQSPGLKAPPDPERRNPDPERRNPDRGTPRTVKSHQEPSEERETVVSLRQSDPKPRRNDDARFDEFWTRYPRKVGKGAARKAYAKAVKAIDHDDLMFALSRQLAGMEAKDPQYRPHPATWLNSERWNDEPEPAHDPRGHMPSRPGSGMVDAFAAVAARRLARDGRG